MGCKLIFIVNADWFFYSHRLNLAKKAIEDGYEVHLITNVFLENPENIEGLTIHNFPFTRLGLNPFKEIKSLLKLKFLLDDLKPDLVHVVTLKPIFFVGILSLIHPMNLVIALSGMGFLFTQKHGLFQSLLTKVVLLVTRLAIRKNNSKVIFQNNEDLKLVTNRNKSILEKSILIAGVGVDLKKRNYQEERISKNKIILMASRLLIDKGVIEFFEAAKIISSQRNDVNFIIAGLPDLGNPNSLSLDKYNEMKNNDFIDLPGFVEDIESLMIKSSFVVLPSYREGFPKVLMEAASLSKPAITTDVPGCNSAVEQNITGLVIPPRDTNALVTAMIYLLDNNKVRIKMGKEAFKKAKKDFDEVKLIEKQLVVYKELLNH